MSSAICCHAPLGIDEEVCRAQMLDSDPALVYQGRTVQVVIPESPLAEGALAITPNGGYSTFTQWRDDDHAEAYSVLQRIVRHWENQGISDYLLYGKEGDKAFNWEAVPYEKSGGWFLKPLLVFCKQLKVLWNITFGSFSFSALLGGRIVKGYEKAKALFSEPEAKQIEAIRDIARGNDAFCNPAVIERQLVFSGRKIDVLYNYAPIVLGPEKLHFLVVPKEHRHKFSDLTAEEYLEAMQLSQKLIAHYHGQGYPTAYLFNKNGADAGQSVPHWHLHVVFTATKTQELLGKLHVFKNMVLGYKPLSHAELEERVQALRKVWNVEAPAEESATSLGKN